MRFRPLSLVLAASFLIVGCDGGSGGPAVGTPTTSATEKAAPVVEYTGKESAKLKQKREKQAVAPQGPQ
jgi:hypothetical protein